MKHLGFNMLAGSVCGSCQGWVSGKNHCVWLTSTFVTASLCGLCNYTLYVTLAPDRFLAWLLLLFPFSSSENETSGIPPLFPYSEAAKPPPSIINTHNPPFTALLRWRTGDSRASQNESLMIKGKVKLCCWYTCCWKLLWFCCQKRQILANALGQRCYSPCVIGQNVDPV